MRNLCEWAFAVGLGFTSSLICAQVWRTMNFWILLAIGIAVCIAARIGIWLIDRRSSPKISIGAVIETSQGAVKIVDGKTSKEGPDIENIPEGFDK